MEQWREAMLTEAAKNAEDLSGFADNVQGEEWLRGLWKKYGLWKLSELFNIGITPAARQNWRFYDKQKRDDFSKKYFAQILKLGPPMPCLIATDTGRKFEVSYGAIIPKFVEPAILLKFDTGKQKGISGDLMTKGSPMEGMPGGSITFKKAGQFDGGECLGAFVVDSTYQTTKGWGPLLYDVAMEMATILGGGLTSSRDMVSSHAKPVWDFYLASRGDVEADQMDINKRNADRYGIKQLTPTIPQDDCDQGAAVKWSHGEDYGAWEKDSQKALSSKLRTMSDDEKANVPWTKQSISKIFKKDPDIIKILGDKGLFHCPELGYDAKKFHSKDLPPLPPEADDMPPPFDDEHYPPDRPPSDEEWAAAEKSHRRNNWGPSTFSEGKIRIKIK